MRVSLEEARRVVEAFERSGQTRGQFAATRAISIHTLDGYRVRLKRAAARNGAAANDAAAKVNQSRAKARPHFVEVSAATGAVSAPEAAITIRLGAVEVLLRPGFDAGTLRQVLDLLEAR